MKHDPSEGMMTTVTLYLNREDSVFEVEYQPELRCLNCLSDTSIL